MVLILTMGTKITQSSIAAAAQISGSYLSGILNGTMRPRWHIAKRLANVVPGTDPVMWLEAEPESLKAIIVALKATTKRAKH